ncbi:MAG: TRAP transporter small permease [Spirochaetia bacterium]|nr:TRAP transporter small permease [Spirochaetia bacterium]
MLIKRMQKLNIKITQAVSIVMCLSVAIMASLIILSVCVRNILGFSFQWIVDVNRLIFIWMAFLGIVYVNEKDMMIRFEIVDNALSPALRRIITIVRHLSSLFLFLVMVRAGLLVSNFAKDQVFSTIPVSTKWLYFAVIAAGILLVYQTTVKILVLFAHPHAENQ